MADSSQDGVRPGHPETLSIPAKGLQRRAGFGLDIGGSMAKVVFATDEGSSILLQCSSYPRQDKASLETVLKEKLRGKLKEGGTVYTCGIGLQEWTNVLKDDFGINIQNLMEMECFVDAFRFLARTIPHEELVYPVSESAKASTMRLLGQMQQTLALMNKAGDTTKTKEPETVQDQESAANIPRGPKSSSQVQYPVLLCILGSAATYIKINADGSHIILDGNTCCGRAFIGLGKHLVQAKNFEELLGLAAKGNHENAHVFGRHLKTGTENDLYHSIADDMLVFQFGQEDDVSREDLAAGLLSSIANGIAQTCALTALAHDIRAIYLCGGFVGLSELIRHSIASFLDFRCMVNPKCVQINYHFLRAGGYLGAIGTLLRTIGANVHSEGSENT